MEQSNKLNRKQRRTQAKMQRRKDLRTAPTLNDAVKGMIKDMKQSPRVQELVVSGKLDKYLS